MAVASCLDISVPATLTRAREIRAQVAEIAAQAGAGEHVVDDVRLCVAEAFTNAVVHGYGTEAGPVHVLVETARDELIVVVSDNGRGLAEFRRDGDIGYGLKIIERLTRRHQISSAPCAGTEVRMVFSLSPQASDS
jgi:anti-sigma regulatory factor (Ser/Thr protein kinase)